MSKASERYSQLSSGRTQFLDHAVECSELTLPYLVQHDNTVKGGKKHLTQPWQSVGAKAVVTLAAKLMLALLPPQTSFFKLQVRDDKLGEDIEPQVRTELDLAFSKIERMVMDFIAASSDRVVVHQALKHLIVSGNALIFMGKDGLKHYPLQRYVHPKEFEELKLIAESKGFLIVASSPLTRSSYHADEDFFKMKKLRENTSQCHQLQ